MGFRYLDQIATQEPMRLCERILGEDPEARGLIQERRLCGPYDPVRLRALPKGSLGHTFVTVLDTIGYDINFFPEPAFFNDLATDADYINYRVFATHDIHHILSGFSLDSYGEVGVISISVGQFNHPGLAFIDLMSLLLNWFYNDTPEDQMSSHAERLKTASYTFRMIHHGLELAADAKLLFAVNWEERMAQNLEELRQELGIQPVTEGPWSWVAHPEIAAALNA